MTWYHPNCDNFLYFSSKNVCCYGDVDPASILYKSIAGRYRPVSFPDEPRTTRYRFIKNANCGESYPRIILKCSSLASPLYHHIFTWNFRGLLSVEIMVFRSGLETNFPGCKFWRQSYLLLTQVSVLMFYLQRVRIHRQKLKYRNRMAQLL